MAEKQYFFVRSVPLLVGVKAETEQEAWILAGNRVDDFMTDAVQNIDRWDHTKNWEGKSQYILDYHGDAIYPEQIKVYPTDI